MEEIAKQAGITVELLRSYQSRGLLPPPRHEGRVAIYETTHLERLRLIRDLKKRGYSLRMVERILDKRPAIADPGEIDAELDTEEEMLSLAEVADRTRVPTAILRSLEASGVLRPRRFGNQRRYTKADVRAVRMLLGLIGGGLPMEDFMRVATIQLHAAEEVAAGAAELFMKYGRQHLGWEDLSGPQDSERMVAALGLMIRASTSLMAYNFQRMMLNAAEEAIDRDCSGEERTALHREIGRRRLELAIPA